MKREEMLRRIEARDEPFDLLEPVFRQGCDKPVGAGKPGC